MVCTANVCQSPMAAAFLQQHLQSAGFQADVRSVGTRKSKAPTDPQAIATMQAMGIDISGHQPREMSKEILNIDGRGLIIAMTRAQLRAVVAFDRNAWIRTFTLKELVRRLSADSIEEQHVRPTLPPGKTLTDWAARVCVGRRAADLVDDDEADDLTDPFGAPASSVRSSAQELAMLTRLLVECVPWA